MRGVHVRVTGVAESLGPPLVGKEDENVGRVGGAGERKDNAEKSKEGECSHWNSDENE